jgi:hypothetical protein
VEAQVARQHAKYSVAFRKEEHKQIRVEWAKKMKFDSLASFKDLNKEEF